MMEKTQNYKENPSNKVKIDLIVIGNPNSGKTSLIRRYIDGESKYILNQHLSVTSTHRL